MLGILIGLFLIGSALILIYKSTTHDIVLSILYVLSSCLLIGILTSSIIIPITGGLYENYGVIKQVGYLTNLSNKGIIWKTGEGEMQKGVGEQATAEKPFHFSVTNKAILTDLHTHLGTKQLLQLKCKKWLCTPFWRGSTSIEVIGVTKM